MRDQSAWMENLARSELVAFVVEVASLLVWEGLTDLFALVTCDCTHFQLTNKGQPCLRTGSSHRQVGKESVVFNTQLAQKLGYS